MSIEVHHEGDLFRATATFKDVNGTLVDPATVELFVLDPSGNTDSYSYSATITKDSTGVYHKDFSLDEHGEWRYWWESTGTGAGAEPGQIVVEGHPF